MGTIAKVFSGSRKYITFFSESFAKVGYYESHCPLFYSSLLSSALLCPALLYLPYPSLFCFFSPFFFCLLYSTPPFLSLFVPTAFLYSALFYSSLLFSSPFYSARRYSSLLCSSLLYSTRLYTLLCSAFLACSQQGRFSSKLLLMLDRS